MFPGKFQEKLHPMLDELCLNIFFVNQTFTLKKWKKKSLVLGFCFLSCGELKKKTPLCVSLYVKTTLVDVFAFRRRFDTLMKPEELAACLQAEPWGTLGTDREFGGVVVDRFFLKNYIKKVGKIKFKFLFQGPLGWVRVPCYKRIIHIKNWGTKLFVQNTWWIEAPLKADLAHVADVYQLVHVKVPSTCQMVYKGHSLYNQSWSQPKIYTPLYTFVFFWRFVPLLC